MWARLLHWVTQLARLALYLGLLLLAGILFVVFVMVKDLCQTTNGATLLSPDGQVSAQITTVDCGATTAWATSVSVTCKDGEPRGMVGAAVAPGDVKMQWVAPRILRVTGFAWKDVMHYTRDGPGGTRLQLEIQPAAAPPQRPTANLQP